MAVGLDNEYGKLMNALGRGSRLEALLPLPDREHARRVSDLVYALALTRGLGSAQALSIATAAGWHDIGKLAVSRGLLDKPGPLDAAEKRSVDRHVWHGYCVLRSHLGPDSLAAEIALLHHERFDGSGHPFGLRGAAIPVAVRIVSVADVYDALISERPYKAAWSRQAALAYVDGERGKLFDPDCVTALLELMEVDSTRRPLRDGIARIAALRDKWPRFGSQRARSSVAMEP